MNGFEQKKRGKKFGLILFFILAAAVAGYAAFNIFLVPPPVIDGIDVLRLLPLNKTVTLKGKNIKSIEIIIVQDNNRIELIRDIPAVSEKTYTLEIKPKELGLKDGSASVLVNLKSGILKKATYELDSIVDTVPPRIEIVKAPLIIEQGGGGFAVLRAKDADSVFIRLVHPGSSREDAVFKAFSVSAEKDAAYFVFFPVPFYIEERSLFYAVAEDAAGNQNMIALPSKLKSKRFKTSSINIDDSFINRVVVPLLNETDTSDPVKAFKRINEDWRKHDINRIIDITQKTEPGILWEGNFLQLKNSKVMATFGDKRTYLYHGKPISESVHLGYDLASTRNTMVEASNSGIVRFAGDLGIYGNTIIIDHGLGLMSLYGHLSTILVKEGDSVKKGDVIAKTGSTGFAGGDHLHFGILIHGYEVSPLYWWDAHWIKVNILENLNTR